MTTCFKVRTLYIDLPNGKKCICLVESSICVLNINITHCIAINVILAHKTTLFNLKLYTKFYNHKIKNQPDMVLNHLDLDGLTYTTSHGKKT